MQSLFHVCEIRLCSDLVNEFRIQLYTVKRHSHWTNWLINKAYYLLVTERDNIFKVKQLQGIRGHHKYHAYTLLYVLHNRSKWQNFVNIIKLKVARPCFVRLANLNFMLGLKFCICAISLVAFFVTGHLDLLLFWFLLRLRIRCLVVVIT